MSWFFVLPLRHILSCPYPAMLWSSLRICFLCLANPRVFLGPSPTYSSLFLSFHWASLITRISSCCWANFPFILPFLRHKTHLFHSHRPGSSLFHHLLYILSFLAGWAFLTSMGLVLDHILDLNSL